MPSFVSSDSDKKVSNIKVPTLPHLEPIKLIKNPFDFKYGESPFKYGGLTVQRDAIKIPVPGEGLPRVLHYCADQSGCAFWRMIWPGDELLAHNKAVVMTLYQMVTFAAFYQGIDAIKLQRQCTDVQLEFIKFLRNVSDEFKRLNGKGFRIIWEVDDVVFPAQDICDYNICKDAFLDDKIGVTIKEMMKYVDEVTTVSARMKDHYKKHLGFDKISVIPNYAPKSWLDRGWDEEKLVENYLRNKQKPRIVYAGSGTHFDVANRVNQQDDFGHIVNHIIKDLVGPKKYQWVFLGGMPMNLRQFVGNGIEFHEWSAITEYPELLKSLNGNVAIAPLANNTFAQCKANIKITEYGAVGLPCVAQNLVCYNSDGWKYTFDTAEEMFKQIDNILESGQSYMKAIRAGRKYAERHFLKDHLDEHLLIYQTEFGDPKRAENEHFLRNNPDQFKS